LDSPDRDPAQMAAPSLASEMVVVQLGFPAAFKPVYLSRFTGLAPGSFGTPLSNLPLDWPDWDRLPFDKKQTCHTKPDSQPLKAFVFSTPLHNPVLSWTAATYGNVNTAPSK
jgi:hypothetical protein